MSERISTLRDFAQKIRNTADIVEVVGQYVELRHAGANLKGLCPFHEEKTPSFHVHPGKQIFKCFGCGKSGDVVGFVREIERVDFAKSLEILAGRYGLEMPELRAGNRDSEQVKLRQSMSQALEAAAAYFEKVLAGKSGSAARNYLKQRGVESQTTRQFRIGLADGEWSGLADALRKQGFSERCLMESGLARKRKSGEGLNDYLRERLVFPILNSRGEVIGFGGRALSDDQQPKYLNTAETDLFRKGTELYGLSLARDAMTRLGQPAVLVEGYMDVVACHQAGVATAVASMGTALTPDQARLLRRYSREVVFLYDADEAGLKAIFRGLEVLLSADLTVRIGDLPAGEDPDSYARANGPQALQQLVAEARPFFDFLVDHAGKRFDLRLPEGRVAALDLFKPVIYAIKEDLVRNGYIHRLSAALGHDEAALQEYLRRHQRPVFERRSKENPAGSNASGAVNGSDADLFALAPPSRLEIGLLRLLIEHSDLAETVRRDLEIEWIEHPLVQIWIGRICRIASSTTDLWSELMEQCESPEHETFLQSVIFGAEEPCEDPHLLAQHLIDRIRAAFRRKASRKLNEVLHTLGPAAPPDERNKVIDETFTNLQVRTMEKQRALNNPCVKVRHGGGKAIQST